MHRKLVSVHRKIKPGSAHNLQDCPNVYKILLMRILDTLKYSYKHANSITRGNYENNAGTGQGKKAAGTLA